MADKKLSEYGDLLEVTASTKLVALTGGGPINANIPEGVFSAYVDGRAAGVVAAFEQHDRRYTANGARLDDFTGTDVLVSDRLGDGALGSHSFNRATGGGLDVTAASRTAVYLCSTVYRRESGVDSYRLRANIVTQTSNQAFGICIGDTQSGRLAFMYLATGNIVLFDKDGVVRGLTPAEPSRVFSAGDTVELAVEIGDDHNGTVYAVAPDGTEHAISFDGFPTGGVWLAYRGDGTTAHFQHLEVDGMSPMVADRFNAPLPIDIFPDPDLEGVSAGALWSGTRDTEDGEPVGIFPASGAAVFSWDMSATGNLRPGASIRYAFTRMSDASGSQTARNAIVFYDSSNGEISRVEDSSVSPPINSWETKEITATVPVNAAKVTLWAGGHNSAVSQVKQKALRLYSDLTVLRQSVGGSAPALIADRRVFVATSGSDSNSGSEGSPMRSLQAAITNERLAGGGDIILMNGEYAAQGLSLTALANEGPISIQSRYGQRARITRNVELGVITKTSGRTKVYQAACPTAPGEWVWQHDVPDERTLIALPDRSAYQKGRMHRLPSTRIVKAASVEAIDSAPDDDPRWYWESGVLYFSVYGGGDGTTADVRVPLGNSLAAGNGARIELIGVDCWYGAISFPKAAHAYLYDVFAFATRNNAISYDACARFISEYCESAGSENDGFSSHNTDDPNYRDSVGLHRGAWAHDNLGDGHSDHACSLVQFDGGLYEHNGKAGIVPANGSHAIARNSHARNNGWNIANGGGGFAITNATSSFDPGLGTQFDLYNCVSENNAYNFMCGPAAASGGGSGGSTDANHTMRVHGGISRNGVIAGYYARVGAMTAVDCRDVGSAAAKLTADGGEITVVTTTALT